MADDPALTDVELQSEIDLVGALVLAASQSEGPMPADEIDEVLGVEDGGAPVPTAPVGAESLVEEPAAGAAGEAGAAS